MSKMTSCLQLVYTKFKSVVLSTHVDRQGVDIRLLFVCLYGLQISPPIIKLVASYFARRFIGVQGRQSLIFVNFAPQKPKIGRIDERAGHAHPDVNITVEMRDVNAAPARTVGQGACPHKKNCPWAGLWPGFFLM